MIALAQAGGIRELVLPMVVGAVLGFDDVGKFDVVVVVEVDEGIWEFGLRSSF